MRGFEVVQPMFIKFGSLRNYESHRDRISVGQSESCVVFLSLLLSLMSAESLIEVLMSTMSLTVVFDYGLVPGLGPLWSPSCVLICVLSGRPFPQIQAQV